MGEGWYEVSRGGGVSVMMKFESKTTHTLKPPLQESSAPLKLLTIYFEVNPYASLGKR